MAETIRLNKVLRELNISIDRAVDFLETKGIEVEKRPTTKISSEVYQVLSDEFETDANKKVASKEVSEAKLKEKEALRELENAEYLSKVAEQPQMPQTLDEEDYNRNIRHFKKMMKDEKKKKVENSP